MASPTLLNQADLEQSSCVSNVSGQLRVHVDVRKMRKALKALKPSTSLRQGKTSILACVLLQAHPENRLSLQATALDWALLLSIDAKIEQTGAVATPLRLLEGILTGQKGDISLSLSETGMLTINDAKLDGRPKEDFPLWSTEGMHTIAKVDATVLRTGLEAVAPAAGVDMYGFKLSCVLFRFQDSMLTLCASDGFWLADTQIPLATLEGNQDLLIPAAAHEALVAWLKGVDEPVVIAKAPIAEGETTGRISFATTSGTFMTRWCVGKFPDYGYLIPSAAPTDITISLADLTLAVKDAAPVAKHNGNILRIDADPRAELTVSCTAADQGAFSRSLAIEGTGDVVSSAYNCRQLQALLACASRATPHKPKLTHTVRLMLTPRADQHGAMLSLRQTGDINVVFTLIPLHIKIEQAEIPVREAA